MPMLLGPRRALLRKPKKLAAAAPYIAKGVVFNGSTAYLSRGANLDGVSDGRVGACSFWNWIKGNNSSFLSILWNTGGRIQIYRGNTNPGRWTLLGRNTSGGTILFAQTDDLYNASQSAYQHIAMSWDLPNGIAQIVIDGVDAVEGAPTITNENIDYNQAAGNFTIGATGTPAQQYNGWLADFWLTLTEFVDFSNPTTLEKFRSVGGSPVDLGSDGSAPTGNPPQVFFKGPASAFSTNLGTGGAFTLNGSLSDAASDPP